MNFIFATVLLIVAAERLRNGQDVTYYVYDSCVEVNAALHYIK